MPSFPRRTALIGAAVCPLAVACSSGNENSPGSAAPVAGEVLAKITDIPLGTGKIVRNTLITQPEPYVFKAFVPRCTHAGCRVTVTDSKSIDCPCHGSTFSLEGAVTRGPASEPLTPVIVLVRDGSIVVG